MTIKLVTLFGKEAVPVEEELAKVLPRKDMLLAIGVFDGVHLGHRYLISQLTQRAKQLGLLCGVVTFHQHPQEVLSPQTKLPRLTSLARRMALIKKEGVDVIITLSFTNELAQLSARQFVSLLKKHLRMRGLIIGPDFALGCEREGNADTLRALGQEMDFNLTVIPPIIIDGEVVSSSAIRNALAKGDMKKVHNLAGYYFSLSGRVITGAGRGKELGFPTANLDFDQEQALPLDGIYATRTYIDGTAYQSVANIGQRPTFGSGQRTVEVYVLDYQGNLYERELTIDIIERLRGEKRFDTVQQLKQQICKDIERGRNILNSRSRN